MARNGKLKTVSAPRKRAEVETTSLLIKVDPLTVGRGHRTMPRGGVHETARRPKRARAKQQWRRQLAAESGPDRFRRIAG